MATFSSSFDGADEDPLSEGGVWDGGYAASQSFKRVSNLVRVSDQTSGTNAVMTYNGATFNEDQYAQIEVDALSDGGAGGFVQAVALCRAGAPAGNTYYRFQARSFAGAGNQATMIAKTVSGTTTVIANTSTTWTAGGDILMGIANSTNVSLLKNGAYEIHTYDTGISGSGRIGIFATEGPEVGTVCDIDNFTGGDLRRWFFGAH